MLTAHDDTDRIRRMVRQRLHDGALPMEEPSQVLGDLTEGRFCAACCRYMQEGTTEIQAIAANGASTFFHPSCFHVVTRERADHADGGQHRHGVALQMLNALSGLRRLRMPAAHGKPVA